MPISYNNNSSFQLQYPQRGQTKSSYYLRSLIAEDPEQDLRSLRYLSEHFIRVKLNLELFKQSKAIMKSVERFILKQLDKKTRTEIKEHTINMGTILLKTLQVHLLIGKIDAMRIGCIMLN